MDFASPRRYDVVASTQDTARELAVGGAPAGTVVAANFQTQGRGRQGRKWYAPPGANVCLTAIAPTIPVASAWQVALVAGLAVCETVIRVADVRARVRFPNDVIVAGAKLAGVLVETLPADKALVIPLIGIGINVNAADFPPEVRAIATTLERVTGIHRDVVSIERALLRHLGLCWDEWIYGGLTATLARWKPLTDPDARRTLVIDGQPTLCRLHDLSPDGTLTLETPDGALQHLPAASVILGDE